MIDPVTALARKWCLHGTKGLGLVHTCQCDRIAAAVREALEEAEKIARKHEDGSGCRICEDNCGDHIADAIAALSGKQ